MYLYFWVSNGERKGGATFYAFYKSFAAIAALLSLRHCMKSDPPIYKK
jgi:hypothetical protein